MIASATDWPELVVGFHFMNPVPVMDGVEVVGGEKTSEWTRAFAHAFAEDLNKETWEADDKLGFVSNRILMPCTDEMVRAFDEGVASADVDRGITLGTNVPMGPLELADYICLDACLDASRTLYEELGTNLRISWNGKSKLSTSGRKQVKGSTSIESGVLRCARRRGSPRRWETPRDGPSRKNGRRCERIRRPPGNHSTTVPSRTHEYGGAVVDARMVNGADVLTAGGVTSGIDLALYLIERIADMVVTDRIVRELEYDRRGGLTAWRRLDAA